MNILKNWTLHKTTLAVVVAWVIAQVVVIIYFWGAPQGSDQGAYIRMAHDCFNNREWYPELKDIHAPYIWSPGFVNYLILQLNIFKTVNINLILNLLMNIGIVFFIYNLSKRFFSIRTAHFAVIVYCLLYSNLMIVAPAGTELPFLFLTLAAFHLCLSLRARWMIIAGVLLALANWNRPFVIVFLPSILIFMIVSKCKLKHYVAFLLPLIFTTFLIGHMTERKIGYFVYQSTTSGNNWIQKANDKAYGGISTSLFSDTTNTCYITDREQYTFVQTDSIWKSRAMEWIKEHPLKYAKLYVLSIGGLYIEDSWSDRPILGGDSFIDKAAHGQKTTDEFIKRAITMAAKSIVYYIICIFFFYSLVVNWRSIFTNKGLLLLILLLGTGGTCLFVVSPRYHYPFLFIMVIWAAYGLDTFLVRRKLLVSSVARRRESEERNVE